MNRNALRNLYLFGYPWTLYVIGLIPYLPDYKPSDCGLWYFELLYEPTINTFELAYRTAGLFGLFVVTALWFVWVLEALALFER